ncbi:hypothetical protein [Duganella vulcania]|uniref:Uncharacterized protein n=1 Tax=Duganella vulcania TaxID=2692166 RepID=A0A845GGA6_9BURK|nr:hypothetical protein [Duganella vulcania]MYM92415.1 hypothetical protein [Duganella vulcania]
MSRTLGKVANQLLGVRYFIHCSTTGYSFSPLFNSDGEAWRVYNDDDAKALARAVPATSKVVSVAAVTLAYGKKFSGADDVMRGPVLGLVTEDRLLSPISENDDGYSLLFVDDVLHISQTMPGGYDGEYDAPICTGGRKPSESARLVDLGEYLDRPLSLCPHCVAKVTANE